MTVTAWEVSDPPLGADQPAAIAQSRDLKFHGIRSSHRHRLPNTLSFLEINHDHR
jgi:hypothetical protein